MKDIDFFCHCLHRTHLADSNGVLAPSIGVLVQKEIAICLSRKLVPCCVEGFLPGRRFSPWLNQRNSALILFSARQKWQLKQLQCFKQPTKTLACPRHKFTSGCHTLRMATCRLKINLARHDRQPPEQMKTSRKFVI